MTTFFGRSVRPSKFSFNSAVLKFAILTATAGALPSMTSAAFAADAATTAQISASTTDTSGSEVGIQEITVTARRVKENVERVPLAITTYTPAKLAEQDIRSISDITNSLPGVEQCCGTTGQLIYVRGIVNGSPAYFADAPVAPNAYDTYFDVSNISVLKGPQGTLFGQASNAGAFLFEPVRPGETLGGTVTVQGGNYGRRVEQMGLDVPLLNDRILTRLAAESVYREGYIKDLSNGLSYGDQNYYIVRPSMTIKITDDLENYTLYQYSHTQDNGNPLAEEPYDYNFQPTAQLPILGTEALFNGGNRAAFDALRAQVLLAQQQLGPYKILGTSASCGSTTSPAIVPLPITNLTYHPVACPGDYLNSNIFVNTTTWNFASMWTLKNILSHTWSDSFSSPATIGEQSLLALTVGSPRNNYPISNVAPNYYVWSDETQLHGKAGRFDLQVGTFNTEHHNTPTVAYTLSELKNGTLGQAASKSDTSGWSHAIYGQVSIDLNDKLPGFSYVLGARQNWDQVAQTSWNLDPNTLAVKSITGGPNSPSGLVRFHNLSYTTSLQYQYTPDTMFYITLARGYSAGGLQNIVGFPSYQPDSLTNLEGGVKSTFDIHGIKTRLNVDIFNGWFNNDQVANFALATSSVTGQLFAQSVIQNAADAVIRGVDLDYTLELTHDFEIGGFASYLSGAFTHWPSINPNTLQPDDLSNTPLRDLPKWKVGIRPAYHVGLGSLGDLKFNANYTYRTLIIEATLPATPTNPSNPRTGLICSRRRTIANGYPAIIADGATVYVDCSPAAGNLDAGVDWHNFLGHENLSMSLQVTNITNNVIEDTRANLDPSLGATALAVAPPRMIYATLKYRF
jgi:iron complex outermembrane receptor protein